MLKQNQQYLQERGIYLRKVRKEFLKKSVIEIEDKNISVGTISHIENNKGNVTEDKVKYYCSKLNLDYHQLPRLIEIDKITDQQKEEVVDYQLLGIENIIMLSDYRRGVRMLNALEYPQSLRKVVELLKGKSHVLSNKPHLAKQHFLRAIRYSSIDDEKNIYSFCYNELGKLSYYEHDYQQALKYTEKGINSFVSDGQRQYIWYHLLINKAIYNEKLGHIGETSDILRMLWEKEDDIKQLEIVLTMYDAQANIHRNAKAFKDAIECTQKGLRIASMGDKPRQTVELWTTLGSIYLDLNQLENAERCLNIAKELRKAVKDKFFFLSVYIKLGELYIAQGKYAQAKSILDQAVRPKNNKLYMSRHIQALTVLGNCFYKQNLLTEAIEPYTEAYKLAQKFSLIHQEHSILRKLSVCWEKIDSNMFHKYLEKYFRLDVELNEAEPEGGTNDDPSRR